MNILALDTATEACSAAILVEGKVLARYEVAGRSHTERMIPMVQALMAEAGLRYTQLDAYVCGIGPGSFAGVRIGLGFMKGLALAADRPAVGVSSLETLAWPVLQRGATHVVTAIDARMGEVYFAGYGATAGAEPVLLVAEQVCAPERAPQMPSHQWHAIGTGWGSYEPALRAATGAQLLGVEGTALPRAEHALAIGQLRLALGAGQSLDTLVPRYLRNKVALTRQEQQALRAHSN